MYFHIFYYRPQITGEYAGGGNARRRQVLLQEMLRRKEGIFWLRQKIWCAPMRWWSISHHNFHRAIPFATDIATTGWAKVERLQYVITLA